MCYILINKQGGKKMFESIWKKTVNSRGYHTIDEMNKIKKQIDNLKVKIRSSQDVIEAFMSHENPNQKRIKANKAHILHLEKQVTVLEEQLAEMEDKNVNRKKA